MKNILVTGIDGFTGQYIHQHFSDLGYQVTGISLHDSVLTDATCDLSYKTEIQNVISTFKPDGVIHLAALSFVAHEDQSAFHSVNVQGTVNLIEAIDSAGLSPDKIIIASSANIYGNPDTENVTEETGPAPVNAYAQSKLDMETAVQKWFDKFNIIITRPFNYTGPGQDSRFLVAKIVDHFQRKSKTIELGNIDVYRNFSDVRDITRAYQLLYESDIKSEIFNLSSGEVFSITEILEMMSEIAGYKINVRVNPEFVRENDIKVLNGSCDKLKQMTSYTPEYTLKRTLKDMYEHKRT